MARRKQFNVHDLYPADYSFDWAAFEADPEHYIFTEDDIAYSNAMELEKSEEETPMTPYERRALRKWVISGHSVNEAPPSKYPCIHCCYPPPTFLDVYREDKYLDTVLKGKTRAEKEAYLKEYIGYTEEPEEVKESRRMRESTPAPVRKKIQTLQRKIFYLYMFIAEQGMSSEAEEYLEDHLDTPAPFEEDW